MAIYDDPATDGIAVDIAAANHVLPTTCRAIFVGGSGNLVVTLLSGTTVTLTGVLAGSLIPIRATTVVKVNTTCTNMVALW